ncbi:MAG: MBL fold metallo-hydrolase [Armatimonadota bacterium]|nr:MBL fold metallo-hydrolase [Armatimonadota bacterium]MDR7403128.1 MBL fold metallo-hydrolase [Armatimonadota bacterium]
MTPRLILLGTGGALQTAARDNTALALVIEDRAVLVDCPGSACRKLLQGGVDPLRLAAVVITHLHTDHVYGLPSLVHNLWLLARGRQLTPVPIYVPEQGVEPLRRLLAALDLDRRGTFLEYRPLPGDPGTVFWEYHGHRLASHPVDHGPETFAIRWETPAGLRLVYSSDTRPLEALAEFGRGASYLVHDATYAEDEADRARVGGHSTPAEAGRVATLAGARRLVLVHLGEQATPARWIAEASTTFTGPIDVPEDGAVYPLG